MSGIAPARIFVAVFGIVLAACATTAVVTPDITSLAGRWRGWIITGREFTPALLEIHPDGTVEMSGIRAPVTRIVTGTLMAKDGTLRLEGTAGWRGAVTVSRRENKRAIRIERDDHLFLARFTEASP